MLVSVDKPDRRHVAYTLFSLISIKLLTNNSLIEVLLLETHLGLFVCDYINCSLEVIEFYVINSKFVVA